MFGFHMKTPDSSKQTIPEHNKDNFVQLIKSFDFVATNRKKQNKTKLKTKFSWH